MHNSENHPVSPNLSDTSKCSDPDSNLQEERLEQTGITSYAFTPGLDCPDGGEESSGATPPALHSFKMIPVFPTSPIPIQPKLRINSPGDKYEQEANKIEEEIGRSATIHSLKDKALFRSTNSPLINSSVHSNAGLTSLISTPNSIGRALDPATRLYMEEWFQQDFSKVRIHTDPQAARFNNQLGARAFTAGYNIFFDRGNYNPGSPEGIKLLAHELTHVVQQNQVTSLTPSIQRNGGGDLSPFYITARAYQPAARRFSVRHLDDQFKENAVIIVATSNGARFFDGHGRVLENRTFNFTTPVSIPNGVYSLEGPGGGNLNFFYRLYQTENNRIAPTYEVATAGEEQTEDVELEDVIADSDEVMSLVNDARYIFLIVPGGPGGAGGEESGSEVPGWASEQVTAVQEVLEDLENEEQINAEGEEHDDTQSDTPDRGETEESNLPDRIILWLNEQGVPYLNIWKDGAVKPLRMREGESEDELLARIRAVMEALKNQADPNQSIEVADGADSTGFTPSEEGDENAVVFEGPAPDSEELLGAETGANAMAYRSEIINYGPDISVTGANQRMAMSLDFSIAGGRDIDQVGARLQHIRYYWELIDVSDIPHDQHGEHSRETAVGEGQATHRHQGELHSLRRAAEAIEEDRQADLEEAYNDPYIAVTWPARVAYFQVIGLSDTIRSAGAVISSSVSVVSQPVNELNIGWNEPGEYIVRCVATPVSDENAAVRRASSVATHAVKVVNINERATQLLDEEENQLEELLDQAAELPEGEELEALLQRIEEIEDRRDQGPLERLETDLRNLDSQIEALEEIGRAEEEGIEYEEMSPTARILRVTLELRGVSRELLHEHLVEQRRLLIRMRSFGEASSRNMLPPLFLPEVVLVSEENGQSYRLVMMLGQAADSVEGNRHYKLLNLTAPQSQDIYEGRSSLAGAEGHNQAVRNAFVDFRENNGYGRGTIAIRLPSNMPEGIKREMTMRSAPGTRARVMQRLQDLATAAEVAAVFVGGPAGIAIGIAGGLAGAAVAINHMQRRSRAGRLEWNFETFMDVSAIIGGVLPFAGLARRAGRFVYYTGIAQLGQSVLVIPYQLERQLREIQLMEGLSPGEKSARRAEALLQAIKSGTITVISAAQMLSQGPPEAGTDRRTDSETNRETVPDVDESVLPEGGTDTEQARVQGEHSVVPDSGTPLSTEVRPSQAGRLQQYKVRLQEELNSLSPDSPEAALLRLEISDINQVLDNLARTDLDGDQISAARRDADNLLDHLESVTERQVDHTVLEVDALPEATVMQPADPSDATSANIMYENAVAEAPAREAAIYRNPETGDVIVIQGDEGTVYVEDPDGTPTVPRPGGEAQRWKELLNDTQDQGRWELQAHYHPVEASSGTVSAVNRMPSGANGDFGVLIYESGMAQNTPRSSRIDFMTPDGMESTIFSYNPGAEHPFVIDFPDAASGQRTRLRFSDLESYHQYMLDTYSVDLGTVPEHLSSSSPEPATAASEAHIPHPSGPGRESGRIEIFGEHPDLRARLNDRHYALLESLINRAGENGVTVDRDRLAQYLNEAIEGAENPARAIDDVLRQAERSLDQAIQEREDLTDMMSRETEQSTDEAALLGEISGHELTVDQFRARFRDRIESVERHHSFFRYLLRGISKERGEAGIPRHTRLIEMDYSTHRSLHELFDTLYPSLARGEGASNRIARLIRQGFYTPGEIADLLSEFYHSVAAESPEMVTPEMISEIDRVIESIRRRGGI